jgi:uncharacterized membrane protein
VTVPIGAWLSSFIFDLVAVFGSDGAVFARGAEWLIGIGVVGAVLAAVFGLLDLTTLGKGTPAQRTALTHMTLNLTVVVLFVIGFIVRAVGGLDRVSVWGIVITVVALILLGISGWLGGKLAFHYGVRVAGEETQSEGFR